MSRLWVLALAGALSSGCAAGLRFGQPELSYRGRVMLLDAEEELLTARAQVDEARRDEDRSRAALAESKARAGFFEDGADAEGERRYGLDEARAQVALAKATLGVARRRVALAEAEAGCAAARYEAEAARVARVTALEGHDPTAPERLAQRAGACDDGLDAPREALRLHEEEQVRARALWEKRRAQLARVSPLGDVRPYLDD